MLVFHGISFRHSWLVRWIVRLEFAGSPFVAIQAMFSMIKLVTWFGALETS
jgi:hypothetical protein